MAAEVPPPYRTMSTEVPAELESLNLGTYLYLDPFPDPSDDDIPNHCLQLFVHGRHKSLFLRLNHFLDGNDLLFSFLGLCGQTISRFVHLGGKEDQFRRSLPRSCDVPDLSRLRRVRLR